MNILVSACLLGVACRYDGKSKPVEWVLDLGDKFTLVPFCPEVYGGLTTPRLPSEIVGDKVLHNDGTDVTEQYKKGAEEALRVAKLYNCRYAILKEKSPSCGKGKIYSGNFDRTLIDGDGITTRLLTENGIKVFGESEIDLMLEDMQDA